MFDKNIIHSGNYRGNAVALLGAGINVANRILLIVCPAALIQHLNLIAAMR